MPHFKLEYSQNVAEEPDPGELFSKLHTVLSECGPFQIHSMKSRIIRYQDFFVSDGTRNQAFVHLELAVLPGRSDEIKKKASEELLKAIKEFFPKTVVEMNCSFTVEIRELHAESYSKELTGEV